MQERARKLDELSGTGQLVGLAGFSPAAYDLTLYEVIEPANWSPGEAAQPGDLFLEGSLEIEPGMNLLQDLDLVLQLEDGRELDVRNTAGDMLAAHWEVTCRPRVPAEFRS